MFCGWGHRRGCLCEICRDLQRKNPRFADSRKTIMKVSEEEKGVQEMLRRPKPGERTGPIEPPFRDPDFSGQYPMLHEMLYSTQYDDRSPRTTSTLLIFCENSILRLCLNDRDNNRSVFFTGETMEAALISLENALATGTVDWRMRGRNGGSGGQTPF